VYFFLDKKGKIFENFHMVMLSVDNKGKIFWIDQETTDKKGQIFWTDQEKQCEL